MNPVLTSFIVAGGAMGLAVAVVLAGTARAHPALPDALAAMDERISSGTPTPPPSPLLRLLRRLPGAVDRKDLDLLTLGRDEFLAARAVSALTYAAAGPVFAATAWLLDADTSVVVPAVFSAAGAVAGWAGHGQRVRQRAEVARTELRFALVSYLQQVGLLRSGGAGVASALLVPARLLADSWAMRRIRDELELTERAGEMPWEGLRRFADTVDVHELADLSSIASTAGHDGGAVVDTLLARAESLRDELLADEHAAANRASGQMSTPGAVQVFLIAAWVLFPAGVALLAL